MIKLFYPIHVCEEPTESRGGRELEGESRKRSSQPAQLEKNAQACSLRPKTHEREGACRRFFGVCAQ